MVFCGPPCPFMVFCGPQWPSVALLGGPDEAKGEKARWEVLPAGRRHHEKQGPRRDYADFPGGGRRTPLTRTSTQRGAKAYIHTQSHSHAHVHIISA